MLTQVAFLGLLLLLLGQRFLELRRSARNERRLRERGATEHAPTQRWLMVLLHGAWFVALPLEVLLLDRPFHPGLAALGLAGVLAGQALRLAAISTLGPRWTVGVLVLPGAPRIGHGPYRWLRHPNYLGVELEIVCMPLLHGAWASAIAFGLANAGLLAWRMRTEERLLGPPGAVA